jgi:phthalate 4,5-dioxygenase oxygenase subunit
MREASMITSEENDLLCRVEGDAPMGQLMRRHWVPACMSEEVAEPDGTPIAVRLLGEDLVVFRDTDGRLGVLDEYCPHRRASLVVGRNEGCAASITAGNSTSKATWSR